MKYMLLVGGAVVHINAGTQNRLENRVGLHQNNCCCADAATRQSRARRAPLEVGWKVELRAGEPTFWVSV